MKKFSLVVIMLLLLVGCSNDSLSSRMNEAINVRNKHDDKEYYTTDIQMREKIATLKNKGDYYIRDAETPIYIGYVTNDNQLESLTIDSNTTYLEESPNILLDSEIVSDLEEAITPGIKTFIKEVYEETENLQPQSKVINNNSIIMYPSQLYRNKPYQYSGYGLIINFNDIQIQDPYVKQLLEAVDQDEYVILEPFEGNKGCVLQVATPFYLEEAVLSEEETGICYYGNPAISIQLYIKEDALNEIEILIKKDPARAIDATYFAAVSQWCAQEWGMAAEEINQITELINGAINENLNKSKGTIAGCDYTYKVEKGPSYFARGNALSLINLRIKRV